MNPQALNRYSYVLNNPLKYVDPTGMVFEINYDWTSQDYMYYFSYGAMAMPVEQTYQNMMNDPDLPLEDKSNLQLAHDADNIHVEFGNYTEDSINALQSVSTIASILPNYYKENSLDRNYVYGGDEWSYHYGFRHDISFNSGGLGTAVGGTSLIVIGSGFMSIGIGSLAFNAPLNIPGMYTSLYAINFGWSRCSNGVELASGNQYSLPNLDKVTLYNTFQGTGLNSFFNLLRTMFSY